MKTITLVFALILIVANKVAAQWVEMNPGINESYTALDCVDATRCFLGGSTQGLVMKTVDGVNWTNISVPTAMGTSWIQAFDKDTCYIHTSSFYRTYDGGNNWILALSIGGAPMHFINTNIAYSQKQQGEISKTTDKGDTWTVINSVPNEVTSITGIYFLDEMNGFIATYENAEINIYKTTDAAQNWQAVFTKANTTPAYSLKEVQMVTNQIGYACGSRGMILKTADGGNTWLELDNPHKDSNAVAYSSLDFINESNGYVIGTQGTILKTIDGGNTWNEEGDLSHGALVEVSIGNLDTAYIASGQLNEVLKNTSVNFTAIIHENNRTVGKIYPNPTENQLLIEIEKDNTKVTLYDVTGGKLFEKNLTKNETNVIDVSHFESGVYIYQLQSSNNSILKTGKIIKN